VRANWRRPLIHALLRVTGSPVPSALDDARRAAALAPEALRALQEERLVQLLQHAWKHTDYYRRVLEEAGVVRAGAVDLACYDRLPLLTKEVLRSEAAALRARALPDSRKPFVNRTGGSTGQPCEFWQDSTYDAVNTADKLHHFELFGKQIGEAELKIWGAQRDLVRDTGSTAARIKNFLYHRNVASCATLSSESIREIVERINRIRPRLIWSYVDGAFAIARYAEQHGLAIHAPAAVFCGGGTFLPPMRTAIEKAFGCPAVNFYGSREMGVVAGQCAEGQGLHITSHSHVVEVLDEAGRAVLDRDGDLVLTSLANYAMPFLRYQIGDRGRLASKPCACGSPFPVLESVSGRSMESLLRADGSLVSPIYLITLLGGTLGSGPVERFQIVQEAIDRVTLKLVIDGSFAEERVSADVALVQQKLADAMGAGCQVTTERVAEIPRQPSGKYLYTVCNVSPMAPSLEGLRAAGEGGS